VRRSILLTVIAVLLAACGAADESGPTIDPVPDDTAEGSDTGDDPLEEPDDVDIDEDSAGEGDAAGGAAGSDPLLGPEIQQVLPDVADRAGVSQDEVLITVTELVTWSDGSLGCPEPDMTYTQALVDGYRIVVEAGGSSYTYHGQNGSDPFHCDDPQEPASVR
jgi:hypothetical protein